MWIFIHKYLLHCCLPGNVACHFNNPLTLRPHLRPALKNNIPKMNWAYGSNYTGLFIWFFYCNEGNTCEITIESVDMLPGWRWHTAEHFLLNLCLTDIYNLRGKMHLKWWGCRPKSSGNQLKPPAPELMLLAGFSRGMFRQISNFATFWHHVCHLRFLSYQTVTYLDLCC